MWSFSKRNRQALALRKHIQKLLDHQRDVLPPQNVETVTRALTDLNAAVLRHSSKESVQEQMDRTAATAEKCLKTYPHPSWRENIEVLLVALTVAMAIRTFFLQPFKIPTGSMQPTLFGVTSQPDYSDPFHPDTNTDFVIPAGLDRAREWFAGVSYVEVRAKVDGELERINPPVKILIFNIYQTLVIGGKTHWIWFPPDYGDPRLDRLERANLTIGSSYRKGDQVVRLKVVSGDHLFVNRLTYNFVKPKRGEIMVFETKGINGLPQDQFYIKRMVALGNEHVQIGNDRHLIINGRRLDSTVPHFEKVYAFDPKVPPMDNHYSGHVNELIHAKSRPNDPYHLAPLFPDESAVYEVAPDHYMVMGDNTLNSLDSRVWGDFPASNVIGKSFFVYWPLSSRFGWGYHR